VFRGSVIAGRFAIEALAGSGGMADVYRARDRHTNDLVALKILRATSPEDLARLSREAQALARLTHPGIVRYVAHGTDDAEGAFVAMEWIEGETLSKRLKKGPLPIPQAITLGRELASALGHAHDHGIVHRDVKPGNVMLRNGALEDPVLLDFGVARTGLAVGLTQVGTVIGTPRYMAPEQARGGQAIDARADVFALGALMFKCFTGRAPFDGDDAIAILAQLLFDDTPDVCALAPGVPPVVGAVIAKMLAKEPADRYPNGDAVVRILDAVDTREIPVDVAVPAHAGLTLRERRLLSLMVLNGNAQPDVDVVRSLAADFGARAEALANGSVVVLVSGRDNATELARVSARCALEIRHALPDVPIVLATGRSEDVSEDPTQTMSMSGEGTASSSRYSGVFERAAGLLRFDHASLARPLPILIDDTTAGLLGNDFEIARGKSTNTHALRGRALIRAHYTLLGKPTPFVGRGRELSSLLATWADVCEQGVARAVLVVGDAGVGKSRLVYEMLAGMKSHEAPSVTLRAMADAESAGSPFAALGAAIRRELDVRDDDAIDARFSKLAARVASVVAEGESHVAEFVAEVCGVRLDEPSAQVAAARQDPRLMSDRIRHSWRAWMRGESARGPVLVVLEDFQWGDLPTAKLLDDMLIDLADSPILVVALARPEIDSVFPNLWSRSASRIPLLPLGKRAAATFARAMLEGATDEVIERIVTLASGNALHLEELVRSWAEGRVDVPESLLAMIAAQIESLPDAERRALRAASVFGNAFWADGVAALLGGTVAPNERVRAETNARLDALAHREMIDARASSRFAARELGFRSTLVRDATYAMLTDDDRRLGHALAADWLESAGEADPFVLAQHRERGGQPDRAIAEYTRSARAALDAGDLATALERARRAQGCVEEGEALAEVLVIAAEANRWRGATNDCAIAAKRAAALAAPNTETLYRALRLRGWAASFSGALDDLEAVADALVACTPSDATLREWVVAAGQVATALFVVGHAPKHEVIMTRLEAIAAEHAARDPDVADTLRTCVGVRAYARGDFPTMIEVHEASARARAELGDERGQMVLLSNLGFALIWLGRYEDSIAVYEKTRVWAAARRVATIELNAVQNASFVKLMMGALDDALEGSREVLRRAEVEAPRSMALAQLCIARVLLARGELGEAERHARLGIDDAPTDVVRLYAHAVLADVLLRAGRLEDARASTGASMTILHALEMYAVGDVYALAVRAEVLEGLGDFDGARESIREARATFDARRAFLRDDAARAMFDARAPEATRLRAIEARLTSA